MGAKVKKFGNLSDGREIFEIELYSRKLVVRLINYGSRVISIQQIDNDGHKNNILLGYENISDYENDINYLGAVLGRCANRIKNGELIINNKKIQLSRNENNNHLHGGYEGFDKKVWDFEIDEKKSSVKMIYTSIDGEEGYPGNLKSEVIFCVHNNELSIEIYATTDELTPVNLSTHLYFNLTGNKNLTIESHKIKIPSETIIEVNNSGIATGLRSIKSTVFELKGEKLLKEKFDTQNDDLSVRNGYDHSYILNDENNNLIEVEDSFSKRKLVFQTNTPIVHFYSGNYLDSPFIKRGGFSFEQQTFCKKDNNIFFYNFLEKDQKYINKSVYKFF